MESKPIAIGIAATAAVGLSIYALMKIRRRMHRFDHLELMQTSMKGNLKIYKVPGTDYWSMEPYFDRMDRINALEVYEDDVWVVTYPKAGTTWTQEIVWLVCNNADTKTANEVMQETRFPFLEFPILDVIPQIKKLKRPRFIKSHLPLGLLPKQFHEVKPKVVYTTRNPKDVLISMLHFANLFTFMKDLISLEELCRQQIGQVGHGSFWDHNQEFWRIRNEPNVLFLVFEDMKEDLPREIRKVANFLNKKLTEEQVMKIAEHCSFKNMKNNTATNMSWLRDEGFWRKGGGMMRKGKVGDWKNQLSQELSDEIDKLTADWLEAEGLTFRYK